MWLALVGPEFVTVIAVLVLLVGVPIFVVAVLAVVSGVLQHDVDRRIAEQTDGEDGESEDGVSDPSPDGFDNNR